MRTSSILVGTVLVLLCGLVGFFGYAALGYHLQLVQFKSSIVSQNNFYGIVKSYDDATRTLVVERLNPFTAGGAPIVSRLQLSADSVVAEQHVLNSTNGATKVSSPTIIKGGFSNALVAGAKVKVTLLSNVQSIDTVYLLVGDPL